MQYAFILMRDVDIEKIETQLYQINKISWEVCDGNIQIKVPDELHCDLEKQIFDAIAAGQTTTTDIMCDENNEKVRVLCGALQAGLLDMYLPEVISHLKVGVVIEIESIGNELSVLRLCGPKESAEDLDRIGTWVITKCGAGVSTES